MAGNVRDTSGSPADMNEILEEVYSTLSGGGGNARTTSAGMRRLRRKLAAREERSVRGLSLGDSWAAPYGASEPVKGWTARAAHDLGGGNSATTIAPAAPHSIQKVGSVVIDDSVNPHRATLSGDGVITYFDLDEFDTIDVHYQRVNDDNGGYAAAVPEYSIDGAPWSSTYSEDIDLNLPGGTSYRLARLAGFTGSSLRLRPGQATTPLSYIFPIIARRGAIGRGVEWMNWGQPGWTTAQWMQVITKWETYEPLRSLPADFFHVNTGANDRIQGQSTAFTLNELGNLLGMYRDVVNPDVAILATLMPYPSQFSRENWDELMDGIADLVVGTFDGVVVDWRDELGSQSEVAPLLMAPDDFHLGDSGQRAAADSVVRSVG